MRYDRRIGIERSGDVVSIFTISKGIEQSRSQHAYMVPNLFALRDGAFDSLGKSAGAWHVGGTTTHASLLTAAVNEGRDARVTAKIESTDAFGSADLMCGKRASIHVACLKVESYLAKCLDGIAEEESTVFMRNARKLRDGLDCAELVVDALDADEAAGIARGLNRGEQVLKRFGSTMPSLPGATRSIL